MAGDLCQELFLRYTPLHLRGSIVGALNLVISNQALHATLLTESWRVCSTACTPLAHEQVTMRQRVKCVTDANGYALYFSRGAIPWNKDGVVRSYPTPWAEKPYLLHLGLQCYDRHFLTEYCKMGPTPLMVGTAPHTYMHSLCTVMCIKFPSISATSPYPAFKLINIVSEGNNDRLKCPGVIFDLYVSASGGAFTH